VNPIPEPRPSKGQVFVKFKRPKYQRGFIITEQQAQELVVKLESGPVEYIMFETAFGGLEFVRLDRFNSIEFINGVESHESNS
jgi:hypothetical protein